MEDRPEETPAPAGGGSVEPDTAGSAEEPAVPVAEKAASSPSGADAPEEAPGADAPEEAPGPDAPEETPGPDAAPATSPEVAPESAPVAVSTDAEPPVPPPADGASDGAEAPAAESQTAAGREPVMPKKGKRIAGKIVQIGESGVFVDFGGREEGVLDPKEIRDDKGELTKAIGDELRVTVLSVGDGVKLTLKGRRPGNLPALLEAHKAGAPVSGRVTGVNKGGLVVRVMGVRAFCPFSQIDRRYIENPEEYVGQKLTFRVSSADEKGRNVVLSRRALLEDEVREKAADVRKELEVGSELSGTVARIRPFGAFVDLGGVDGMVHVSEISHSRVTNPADVLKVGQEVRVRIVKVEDLGGTSERISLSMKQLEADPWEAAVEGLSAGQRVQGKVVRVVDFGAFVEIVPGVDGLIHVSALAGERVEQASDIVSPGDEVEAWVLQVDRDKRRVSLSLVDPADRPARTERPQRQREPRAPKVHRTGAEGHDGLTSMGEAFQRLRERMEDD